MAKQTKGLDIYTSKLDSTILFFQVAVKVICREELKWTRVIALHVELLIKKKKQKLFTENLD